MGVKGKYFENIPCSNEKNYNQNLAYIADRTIKTDQKFQFNAEAL